MDATMLEQVLGSIHNWFVRDTLSVGECTISNGALPASVPIPNGVWYRIQGSYLNDGMHLKGGQSEGLVDETFTGTITTHVIPKPLLAVCEEISAWQAKYGTSANSPFQSESFGGYTYNKGTTPSQSSDSKTPRASGWQQAFSGRLTRWRKLS